MGSPIPDPGVHRGSLRYSRYLRDLESLSVAPERALAETAWLCLIKNTPQVRSVVDFWTPSFFDGCSRTSICRSTLRNSYWWAAGGVFTSAALGGEAVRVV